MDANRREFSGPLDDEVYNIVGCAFEILNELGNGLVEKPYENALVVEFELQGIPFDQQKPFTVLYKSRDIGTYRPDLIAYNSVIVDTKIIDRITNVERAQVLNYIKITGLEVGLILNFKKPRLEWERLVRSNS